MLPRTKVEACRALANLAAAAGEAVYHDGILPVHVPPRAEVDVVCLHGLAGDPLSTFRRGGTMKRLSESDVASLSAFELATREALADTVLWPRDWLADDLGSERTRVISVTYKSALVESDNLLGVDELAARITKGLHAAGVGRGGRPVVFISHSLGGILTKKLLVEDSELSRSTRAVVFFAVPHHGANIANIMLKEGGFVDRSSLVPSIHAVAVKSGEALEDLHQSFVELAAAESIRVLSFAEGQKSALLNRRGAKWIKEQLVTGASANAGIGPCVTLGQADHFNVCKPAGRHSISYVMVLQLFLDSLA